MTKHQISVYYSKEPLYGQLIDKYVQNLPIEIRNKIGKKKKNIEQSIRAYTMLNNAVLHLYKANASYYFNKNGKPFIDITNCSISISHSKNYSVIGISNSVNFGIDIELSKKSRISNSNFIFFTEEEKCKINKHTNKETLFIETWSKKEAVIKAIGETMFNIANKIDTTNNPVKWGPKTYHLKEILLEEEIKVFAAVENTSDVRIVKKLVCL